VPHKTRRYDNDNPLDASPPPWFKLEERGAREEAASRKGEFTRLQGNYTDSLVFSLFL
jgi:hypothetical protein